MLYAYAYFNLASSIYARRYNMYNEEEWQVLIQSIQALEPCSSISVSDLLASLVWLSLTLTARKLFGNFTLQDTISVEPGYEHLNIIRVEFCS